ncbi:MAG TPA: alcohol dehydrogenase catalytic domain-containing protein [Actinomycetota bacterium]|nr:alcohol dehydrogenase catalytic domain-containing protein [Actinomycetota bacterium]
MKSVVLDGPSELRLEQRPEPRPGPGEALVAIHSTGICGTDLSIFADKIPVTHPLVLGHEMVGAILEIEGGFPPERRLQRGDRVLIDPVVYCGTCYQCSKGQVNLCPNGALMGRDRDGGFSNTVAVPAANLYSLPRAISDTTGPLLQVLTTCMHAQRQTRLFPGESVLVMGLGVAGLLHIQLAVARGASPVIGVTRTASKRALAERLGADVTIDPSDPKALETVLSCTSGRGVDVAIEAVGRGSTLARAIEFTRIGGRLTLFGTITESAPELPYYQLYYKELMISNPRAAKPEDFPAAIDIVSSGAVELEPLVTDVFPLSRAREAIAATGSGGSLKVILDHLEGATATA